MPPNTRKVPYGNDSQPLPYFGDIVPPPLATSNDVLSQRTNNNVNNATSNISCDHHTEDSFHRDIGENTTSNTDISNCRYIEEDVNSEQQQERRMVRTVLRKYSTVVCDPTEESVDEKRVHHALKDAGFSAYGLQGIAVWVFDDDQDRLVSVPGGFWYNESIVRSSEALQQLIDNTRSDHVTMSAIAPGTDIAGLLWLESNNRENLSSYVHGVTHLPHIAAHHQSKEKQSSSNESLPRLGDPDNNTYASTLIWRDLKSLVQDPDTAKGPFMELLERAGFGQATGIRFESGVTTGFVIFLVKTDVDESILNGVANVSYLRQCAQFIGTSVSMTEARRAIVGQLLLEKQVRVNSDVVSGTGGDDTAGRTVSGNHGRKSSIPSMAYHRLRVWLKKARGGGLQIPPPLSFRQSLWTAFGAFVGLLVLSSLNEYYKFLSDDEYFLLIGPFGALMTLQYGLPGAPASQPRNAVMGQAVAGAVSLAFTYIPESILATWLRRAIGPALGIASMVKFGFVHPPAGAHAVLYASGDYSFVFYGLVVLSTAISIIPATLVNNMSRKRQYPTYWGFVPTWIETLRFDRSEGSNQKDNYKN